MTSFARSRGVRRKRQRKKWLKRLGSPWTPRIVKREIVNRLDLLAYRLEGNPTGAHVIYTIYDDIETEGGNHAGS